jgi:hypothetical protein
MYCSVLITFRRIKRWQYAANHQVGMGSTTLTVLCIPTGKQLGFVAYPCSNPYFDLISYPRHAVITNYLSDKPGPIPPGFLRFLFNSVI